MLAELGARPSSVASRRPGGALRRTSVFIVCSPRPRVGRTLIARLLVDYLVADDRAPFAFDANPNDPVLSAYQPRHTVPATLANTFGEMALFDRLILWDGRPKVVDLAPDLFDAFFASAETIAFVDSARAKRIDTVALYVVENHAHALAAHRNLLRRLPRMTVVPVVNEALFPVGTPQPRLPQEGMPALRIGVLPPTVHGVVMRPHFSLRDYFMNQTAQRTLLHRWIGDGFVGFRDVELRLRMAELAALFAA
jgi:hypothetical protein